jgi:putative tricarboxylic transport membrane protein
MLESFIEGLLLVFQWPAPGYLFLGVILGIWLGAVPGLGGIIGLVILLPFTFGMEPVSAIALLLGMYAVTTSSDTIASVMLGIPGTAASQATILDGYPLAQKGKAARAFGAAFTVSAFGGVFGGLILAVSLPIVLPVILAFGSPELFMLGILGLSMVGSLSGGSALKGLTIALLGLLMATIGYSETGVPRYWFGSDYLIDGLPMIPVVLGFFAIPELMELAIKNVSISRIPKNQADDGGMLDGIKDAFRHKWLTLRCSLIGTYIGILPGLGASIVDWIAYGHAVQSAKDKSQFGQGDIRGVIAPETANNASKGGALIPTVAFGIPGSLGTAILMGALVIQDIKPGPEMLTSNLHITFSMVWTIIVANILVALLLMMWSKQVAKVAFIRGHLIVPGVILFVFMGAWLGGASIGDWVACLAMGVIGFIMKRGGWPRPPLVLALILGPILENSFQLSLRTHQGYGWLEGPIVLIILALIVLTLVFAIRNTLKSNKEPNSEAVGEGSEKNPIISLPLAMTLFVVFVLAGLEALNWSEWTRQFPLAITIPAAVIALIAVVQDLFEVFKERRRTANWTSTIHAAVEKAVLGKAGMFFGYLMTMVLMTLAVGQQIALCLFVATYLWRWGGYGWRVSLAYAGVCWLFLYGFYDQVMNILWHPSWLFG